MRWGNFLPIILGSAMLAMAFRFGAMELAVRSNVKITHELCDFVGNALETDELRNIYEGIEGGLRRSGVVGACIVVTDNGGSFSRECIRPEINYQTVTCQAEANRGVQASVFFPATSFFSPALFGLFIFLSVFFLALSILAERFTRVVVQTFSADIAARLAFEGEASRVASSFIQRLTNWLLRKSGISESIRTQADRFQGRLAEYEEKMAHDTSLRIRKEQEAKSDRAYIEKVKLIRHDIRSPLTSLQAVRERIRGDEEVEKAFFLAIRRIQVILDQLDEEDRVVEESTLLIAEIVADDVVFGLKPKFLQGKGVALAFHYDPQQLSPVMGGREGLSSVVDNLLQNAFDAVGTGGKIGLSISSSAAECIIEVTDNGCGIPAGAEAKIFGRGATFGKVNGIGLGLFHTKKSVENWGGSIQFERLAQGTKFIVKLPLAQTGVQFVGLLPGSKLKVIDDDSAVQDALVRGGYEVVETAGSYQEGRNLLGNHQGDGSAVLVDYRLEDNHFGTDLIAEFRGRAGMVLCTDDFDDANLIKKARGLGVKILPKPLCFSASPDGSLDR